MTIDSEETMTKYRVLLHLFFLCSFTAKELYKRAYEITLDWLHAFEEKLKVFLSHVFD
jgi:hypothetical protein